MKAEQELAEEQLIDIKKRMSEALAGTRQELLIDFPFIGNITMHMDLIPVRDKRCRTACTDGNKIFWDIEFFASLSEDERKFVMAHEVWHAVMLHLVRCQTRDASIWNIASDMEVNFLLEKQNGNGKSFVAPKGLCFPPKRMEGKSAEAIYEWLLKKMKKEMKQQNQQNGNSSSSGSGSTKRNRQHSGNNSYDDVMSEDDRNEDGNIPEKNGTETGKLEGQFDNHIHEGKEDENSGNEVKDRWGKVGYDKDFTPRISSDFADRMRETVIAEAQRCQRMQGKLPAELEGILEKIMKPEVNWQEQLQQFVTRCFGDKRQWLPPHRRGVYNEMYFQSRRNEKINVTVAIDTSGSCIGDIPKFFSELINLLKSFGGYKLNLIYCDADISKFETYDESNPFPIDNIKDIKWYGGGGTSFKPPFEYVRKHAVDQDCFIYFTDSYGDAPTYAPPYPVLWILTKDSDKEFCSWGKKIIFKNRSYDE